MRPSTKVKIGVALGGAALFAGLIAGLPRAARWLGGATSGLEPHESRHFVVYASDPAEAGRISGIAEAFCDDLVRLHGARHGFALPDPPVSVYVFDAHDGLARYSKMKLGQWLDYNGGYFSARERALALIRGQDDALRHELTHMMVAMAWAGAEVSPWFSEGQAQWFETGAAGSYPPAAAARARKMVESGGAMPLRALLEAPESTFAAEGNAQPYALSFALYAWLAIERPDALERVTESERRPGRASAADFQAAVGAAPDDTEREWRAWISTPR